MEPSVTNSVTTSFCPEDYGDDGFFGDDCRGFFGNRNDPQHIECRCSCCSGRSQGTCQNASAHGVVAPPSLDIIKFRGRPMAGDPPVTQGTAETNVEIYLQQLETYFTTFNVTDDKTKIQRLVSTVHHRFGDARIIVPQFADEEYRDYTYEDVVSEMLEMYGDSAGLFVEAARDALSLTRRLSPDTDHNVLIALTRDAARNAVNTFLNRPKYNPAREQRPLPDVLTNFTFALLASDLFTKRVMTATVLDAEENIKNARVYRTLRDYIRNSDEEVYTSKFLRNKGKGARQSQEDIDEQRNEDPDADVRYEEDPDHVTEVTDEDGYFYLKRQGAGRPNSRDKSIPGSTPLTTLQFKRENQRVSPHESTSRSVFYRTDLPRSTPSRAPPPAQVPHKTYTSPLQRRYTPPPTHSRPPWVRTQTHGDGPPKAENGTNTFRCHHCGAPGHYWRNCRSTRR